MVHAAYLSFSCEVGMRDHLSVSSSYSALLDIISTSSGGMKLSTITDLKKSGGIVINRLGMCKKCVCACVCVLYVTVYVV